MNIFGCQYIVAKVLRPGAYKLQTQDRRSLHQHMEHRSAMSPLYLSSMLYLYL
jgi:hypothetical protein